jgi:two-component system, NarL family, nitrate/nitrite response regulator NarL
MVSVARILIADDHPIFRDGLRKLLSVEPDFRVVGDAGDGYKTLELVQQLRPNILLLDLAMRPSGLEILAKLSVQSPSSYTIVLTAAIQNSELIEALRLGARGVVLKNSATAVLLKSIRAVMAEQYWVGHGVVANLIKLMRDMASSAEKVERSSRYGLTARELEVVSAIVAGHSNKEIAQKYSISEFTVKHHLTNVYEKLGVSTRLELAAFAMSRQLVGPDCRESTAWRLPKAV